jgi:hypothetical protein
MQKARVAETAAEAEAAVAAEGVAEEEEVP